MFKRHIAAYALIFAVIFALCGVLICGCGGNFVSTPSSPPSPSVPPASSARPPSPTPTPVPTQSATPTPTPTVSATLTP